MNIITQVNQYRFHKPFVITGHVFETSDCLELSLSDGIFRGHGEAVGSYYLGESAQSMTDDIAAITDQIDGSLTLDNIQSMLPPGGARNALDCAYWDFVCKSEQLSIWELLNIQAKPLTTVFTLGIEEPETLAKDAVDAANYPHLKIKLDNDRPIEKLEAIRAARPDAKLIIDVNQGWSFSELVEYAPHCARLDIAMIEQPLPRGDDSELEVYQSPVPLGADESCLHLGEFQEVVKRYQVLNIKLDKCGGLTEALHLVKAAQQNEMKLMVGNMAGSSLSMAPSFVIGQFCQFIDIDGPLLLSEDVENGLEYSNAGEVAPPTAALWG